MAADVQKERKGGESIIHDVEVEHLRSEKVRDKCRTFKMFVMFHRMQLLFSFNNLGEGGGSPLQKRADWTKVHAAVCTDGNLCLNRGKSSHFVCGIISPDDPSATAQKDAS